MRWLLEMKRALKTSVSILLLAAAAAAWPRLGMAQGEIFLCTDDQGRKTYQNTGNAKGCKKIDVQPIMTVPAPRMPARAQNGGTRPATSPATSPASFPRVDGAAQKSLDSDRRRILEEELKVEEEKLVRLRTEYNNGEPERRGDERNYALYQERVQRLQSDIARSENNVASLKREISLLQRQ